MEHAHQPRDVPHLVHAHVRLDDGHGRGVAETEVAQLDDQALAQIARADSRRVEGLHQGQGGLGPRSMGSWVKVHGEQDFVEGGGQKLAARGVIPRFA